MVHFNKVTIIGVGLIGGSLARVMKAQGIAGEIHGAGRGRSTLELALGLGIIDRIDEGASHGVGDADLVVLASPVGTFETIVREIAPHLKKGATLTDVGSVKGALVRKIEDMLPEGVHYVPAHPIAGKEKHGVSESSEALFRRAKCIITPTGKTGIQALETVKAVWLAAGANVIVMDADLHDKVFAAVSHLPHVAAYAMISTVAGLRSGDENYLDFSGGGFRDFTRIAASSPEMWKDICLMNRDNIIPLIDRYVAALNQLKREIIDGDEKRLEQHFKASSDERKRLG